MINKAINRYKDDIINKTLELIQIPSIEGSRVDDNPFGNEVARSLEYMLNLGKKLGFKTKNIDNYVGYIEMGQGKELFGILGHVDVVPAETTGWKVDPFKGDVIDDAIYGRGAIDDKGPLIASLYAMKIAKDINDNFKKRVRLIIGTNEETGWGGINYYIQNEEIPSYSIVPDSDFPLIHGEKGTLVIKITKNFEKELLSKSHVLSVIGGTVVNIVPDLCEAKLKKTDLIIESIKTKEAPDYINIEQEVNQVIIKCKGKAAHGSTPEAGINAINRLLAYLVEILPANDSSIELISSYNNTMGKSYNGDGMNIGFEDEVSGKLTMNVGMINLDKDSIEIELDIRYPLTTEKIQVLNNLEKELTKQGYKMNVTSELPSVYTPKEDEFVKELMDIYNESMQCDKSQPIVIGGATYARAMKNAFAFGPLFPGVQDTCHQKNELFKIEHIMKFTEIYVKTILKIAC